MLFHRWSCFVLVLVAVTTAQAESVHRETLPGGMVLIVQEFHQTAAAEVRVAVRAGPLNEGALLGSGASLLLQRVLLNSSSQGSDESRRASVRLGNRLYAETTVATAVYGLSTTGDQIGDGLGLLASLLTNQQYTQLDLQRERDAIQALPAPSAEALGDELLSSLLYRQHPARLPVQGLPAMLDLLTIEQLRLYQEARYTTANTVVTVVGNVNTNDVRQQVIQAFAHYALGGFQPAPICIEPAQVGPRYASGQFDLPRPRVLIAWRTEAPGHSALPAVSLLSRILGDSVLPAALAAAKVDGQAWSGLRFAPDQPGALVVGFNAPPEGRADGERAVYAALEALAKDGPSAASLAAAKRQLRCAAAARLESAHTRAEDLEHWELATGDPSFPIADAAAIEATTAEEVAKAARRYGGDAHACTVVLRAAEQLTETSSKIADPASSVAPSVIDLGGGLRLIAHPPGDVPVMHVRLTLGGAVAAEEPQLSGSAAALAALLPRGAGARSAADITTLCQTTGLAIGSQCDHDGLSVSITCLSDDGDKALELITDMLTRPTLAAAELDAVRGELLRRIDVAASDRRSQLLAACREVVLAGDPLARPASGAKDVVARLDRNAIEALWKRIAVSGNAVLSISGRYDRGTVVETLGKLLKAQPALNKAGAVTTLSSDDKAAIPPLSVIYREGRGAAIALVWNTPAYAKAPADEAPLAVLTALLVGVEVPAGRINSALSSLAGTPTLSACTEIHSSRGLWIVHGEVDETTIDAVKQVAREQVAQLLGNLDLPDTDSQALGATELATAKQMCLTAHALRHEDSGSVSARAAVELLAGVDLGRDASLPARIAAVTAADLQRVAKTWLACEPVIVVAKPHNHEGPPSPVSAQIPEEGAH